MEQRNLPVNLISYVFIRCQSTRVLGCVINQAEFNGLTPKYCLQPYICEISFIFYSQTMGLNKTQVLINSFCGQSIAITKKKKSPAFNLEKELIEFILNFMYL